MKNEVYNLIKKASFRDRDLISLAGHLHVNSEEGFNQLTKALYELTQEGLVYRDKDGYYHLISNSKDLVKGVMDLKASGYGFLIVDDEKYPDIFIPRTQMKSAMDKDTCLVEITKRKGNMKLEGKIVKVLERNIQFVVGEVYEGQIFPKNYTNDLVYKLQKKDIKKAKDHQLIKAKIVDYSHNIVKLCELVEVIGHVDDEGIEILEVINKYNLTDNFSDDEMAFAKSLPQEVLESELKGRRDLRGRIIFTIDGESTKDIDDAVSIEILPNKNYLLGVHIADVSHYVKEGSVLDKCAYNRGTSVYLANSVIPMLPRELSNGICSLNPDVDRLTISCDMEINHKGEVLKYDIYPSIIHSKYKMTYTNINKMLDGDEEKIAEFNDIYNTVLDMHKLQNILSDVREKMGSINFETIEPKLVFDESGKISDLVIRDRLTGERMIEEFMLVANQVVATHVSHLKLPFVYRIHELPNQDKLNTIHKFVEKLGYKSELEDSSDQYSLQQLLKNVEGTTYEKVINTLLLRAMSKARYSSNNKGHYGLAFDNYTHFTSPIRRYPDLIVHRLLRRYVFKHDVVVNQDFKDKLEDISIQASKTERVAMNAEREVMDMKKAEYMESFIGQTYTGVISSVLKFGIFVELPNTVEGLVHISTFKEEMQYDENNFMLIGISSKKQYNIGMEVNVKLVKVNKLLGKIDFELV